MTPDPRRTYYNSGDTTKLVVGAPRVKGPATEMGACPHCACATLYDIVVDVVSPILSSGKGIGVYVGCPACPFASPMLMISV